MNFSRQFRVLIVLVAGTVVGTVLYRYGLDTSKVVYRHMSDAMQSRDNMPLSIHALDKVPSNVVQMARDDERLPVVGPLRSNLENSDGKSNTKTQSSLKVSTPLQTTTKSKSPTVTIQLTTTKLHTTTKPVVTVKSTSVEAAAHTARQADKVSTAKPGVTALSSTTTSKPTTTTASPSNGEDDNLPVPRIVHYTWYSTSKLIFRFHHFISMLSAYKHIKPRKIMFWYEIEPRGPWWMEIRNRIPIIEMKFRKAPREIFGKKISVAEHQTDIVRLEAVMQYGGIYTDLDVIVTKSFDPLRKYNTTMGYETQGGLCNGIIISAPNAPFLKVWHETYHTFNDGQWAYHSVQLPAELARKHANLIHTELDTLHRPNWIEKDWLYQEGKIWNWSKNYAVHLWYRFHNVDHNPEDIKTLNTTMGQLFRYIYYGSKDLIKS